MTDPAPTWLVTNTASGSHSPEAIAELEAAFARAGHPLARIVRLPDEEPPTPAQLDAAGVGTLAVYTGDGSVNWVITGLYDWTGAVLVLPGGTQNLLAKALHGDAEPATLVEALGAGRMARTARRMIRTSQGDALCEVLAGPGAHWSDVREAMRDRDLGAIASTLGQALGQTTGEIDQVRVADPALGAREGYPAVRLHIVDARMKVDGYGAQTLGEYAQQGLALIKRDFRDGPHDELGLHPAVTCTSEAPIELMIDGERKSGATDERFELLPCPVEFLASSGHRGAS